MSNLVQSLQVLESPFNHSIISRTLTEQQLKPNSTEIANAHCQCTCYDCFFLKAACRWEAASIWERTKVKWQKYLRQRSVLRNRGCFSSNVRDLRLLIVLVVPRFYSLLLKMNALQKSKYSRGLSSIHISNTELQMTNWNDCCQLLWWIEEEFAPQWLNPLLWEFFVLFKILNDGNCNLWINNEFWKF